MHKKHHEDSKQDQGSDNYHNPTSRVPNTCPGLGTTVNTPESKQSPLGFLPPAFTSHLSVINQPCEHRQRGTSEDLHREIGGKKEKQRRDEIKRKGLQSL